MELDEILPNPDFQESHERLIAAPPDATWEALMEVSPRDLPLTCALMAVRLLPAIMKLDLRRQRDMLSRSFVKNAPIPLLAVTEGHRILTGGVLQPWKLRGGEKPPALSSAALRAFDQPGWVKCGMDFELAPEAGGTRLTTRTSITATDPGTRARFGRYWTFVRPGSGLIRVELLRAVAKKAVQKA
ncbi:MAG: hypothetical protein M3Y23_04165 [Actinomycetota bacterium]|nr:hypothetical protein [Actinomycetota bacterium]